MLTPEDQAWCKEFVREMEQQNLSISWRDVGERLAVFDMDEPVPASHLVDFSIDVPTPAEAAKRLIDGYIPQARGGSDH